MPPTGTTPVPAGVAANVPADGSLQPPATVNPDADFQKSILELHAAEKLLVKKEYPALRKLFADRFAAQQAEQIRTGLGADYEAMMAWFEEHPNVREELYIAIDPEADAIPRVLAIFNEIRKTSPDKLEPYANLAIATALVWDDERRGVYQYDHHAQRCKANLPSGMAGAIDNFNYFVKAEPVMQGRIQYAPWELLVYVVNHHTPEPERIWAVQNYLPKRSMFGKCYSDVPYDHLMLDTQSEQAKLNNKEYTLPNIKTHGGVCAMQADFASRVGKSMGVSAEYVRGESAGGDWHAWVMWVELKQATPTGLVFSLESHGRYRGDKYYVGTLADPQTGKQITDRDMELRLQTVGLDTVAKRQAGLVMQVYPLLCEKAELDTNKRLKLLSAVIGHSPGCEAAWYSAAKLARESSGQKPLTKQFQAVSDKLFTTFVRVPDFTWKVFDDLAAFHTETKQRDALYDRLAVLYESAGRPDLACEARLKLADYLAAEDRNLEAVQRLAITVKKFPEEGRYVPKMLDKIDELCAGLKDADQQLVAFYTQFLPLIPQMRDDRPSPYCIATYERAINLFTARNRLDLAQSCQIELENVKAGKGRQKR